MSKDKLVKIEKKDLRRILFWAAIGVCYSQDGQYSGTILDIIEKNRREIKMQPGNFCGYPPRFGKWRRRKKKCL